MHAFAGDLMQLFDTVRADIDPGKDICVFGGGPVLTQLLDLGLIDEIGLSNIPVVLGSGVPFFGAMGSSTRLELMDCRPFPSGIVALNYRVADLSLSPTHRAREWALFGSFRPETCREVRLPRPDSRGRPHRQRRPTPSTIT